MYDISPQLISGSKLQILPQHPYHTDQARSITSFWKRPESNFGDCRVRSVSCVCAYLSSTFSANQRPELKHAHRRAQRRSFQALSNTPLIPHRHLHSRPTIHKLRTRSETRSKAQSIQWHSKLLPQLCLCLLSAGSDFALVGSNWSSDRIPACPYPTSKSLKDTSNRK
jgi:hypothetical protein